MILLNQLLMQDAAGIPRCRKRVASKCRLKELPPSATPSLNSLAVPSRTPSSSRLLTGSYLSQSNLNPQLICPNQKPSPGRRLVGILSQAQLRRGLDHESLMGSLHRNGLSHPLLLFRLLHRSPRAPCQPRLREVCCEVRQGLGALLLYRQV